MSIAWDHLMAKLHCCGVNDYTDFYASTYWIQAKEDKQVVPPSCCILDHSVYPRIIPQDSHCIYTPTSYNSYWMQGCLPALSQVFHNYSQYFLLLMLLLLIFNIVVLLLGLFLCCLHTNTSPSQTVIVAKEFA